MTMMNRHANVLINPQPSVWSLGMSLIFRNAAVVVITALAAVGCTTSSSVPFDHSISIRLESNVSAVVRGDSLTLTLRILNNGPEAASLALAGDIDTGFEPVVRDSQGHDVWHRFAGQAVSGTALMIVIPPHGERVLVATWGLRDDYGHPVVPGEYLVVGRLPLDNGDILIAPNTITVTVAGSFAS